MVEIKVDMKDVLRELENFPVKIRKKLLRKAVKASAKPIVEEAKNLVPVKTGNLKKSIGVVKIKSKKRDELIYAVTPRTGKGVKYDGWYGRLVELGHIVREKGKKKKGEVIGHVPPHPFLRPAFERRGEKTIVAFKEALQKFLQQEAKKNA